MALGTFVGFVGLATQRGTRSLPHPRQTIGHRLFLGGAMSDASNRAERYRELAEGCRRLAAIAFSTETRGGMLCGQRSMASSS
jgi:hypothetical protein